VLTGETRQGSQARQCKAMQGKTHRPINACKISPSKQGMVHWLGKARLTGKEMQGKTSVTGKVKQGKARQDSEAGNARLTGNARQGSQARQGSN
jgi:hypothetical protein